MQWVRLSLWDETAGAPAQGLDGFCGKAQERMKQLESAVRSQRRRKALKGETQERWGLKQAPKGMGG
jgi:hypothetical protein